MSRRSASNTASPAAQVLAVLGQPLERPLDLLRLELAEIVHGSPPAELARGARGRDRGAAPVRLEAHLDRPVVLHPQEETREVAAADVLVLADPVGVTHKARVARVEEMVHERRAVPHAAPTGITCRSFRTSGSTHSIT